MPNTPNRNYPYPSEYDGDWYNTFVEMLMAIDADIKSVIGGGVVTGGSLTINTASPFVRFAGTEAAAGDFRFVEQMGVLYLQCNTNNYATPVWKELLAFTQAGDIIVMSNSKGVATTDADGVVRRMGFDVDGAPLYTSYP